MTCGDTSVITSSLMLVWCVFIPVLDKSKPLVGERPVIKYVPCEVVPGENM